MAKQERKPFKEGLDTAAIEHLAAQLDRVSESFDRDAFVATATEGLVALELKDRVRHVISALRAHLPREYPDALDVVLDAARGWQRQDRDDGLAGFAVWPLIDFVGEHGVEHFDASMAGLRELTPRWSAEFAVRPFLDADPQRALSHLRSWLQDPDEHVRRLISEGSRTRLPWGGQLKGFIADPSPVLELLEALRDDPSEYVRRSVANNLNDISKDHPEVVVETCNRWAENASAEREKLIRHALRTLVKKGDGGALGVLGFDPDARVEVLGLEVRPKSVRLGEGLRLRFDLVSKSHEAQPLVIDYAVHHVKKAGHRTAKVFKLKTLRLAAGARITVEKKHPLKSVTVRRYHAGRHAVEILVNGRPRGMAEFELEL